MPSPRRGPGVPGKVECTVFFEWRAAARIAFPRSGARSARKKVQCTVFSKGRAAARIAFPGMGKEAAKRPDEVVALRHTALTCRGYPVVATILQFRTGRTTSSVCSLRSHPPSPTRGRLTKSSLLHP